MNMNTNMNDNMNTNNILNKEERPISNTETCRIYHDNGKLKIEIQMTDGKPDGISKSYYENGQLEQECSYVRGKRHGISKYYT